MIRRYLVVSVVLVGLAWGATHWTINGQTPYSMAYEWTRTPAFQAASAQVKRLGAQAYAAARTAWAHRDELRSLVGEEERPPLTTRAPQVVIPRVQEPPPPRKTRVDERLAPEQKKALDDLVTARVSHR